MSNPPQNRRTLLIVFLTVFLDLVGFGIIIPIQPFFAEKLGATPTVVTMLGGSFSLMQFLFASVWGRASDRIGRRPVMLISILTTAAGYVWFGCAESLSMLFAARMLAGLGSANIGTAQAIIADSTTPETRAKGMGIIGAAFGLGFIFGPALGAMLGQFGLAVPAFGAAAFSSINFIIAYFILPETNPLKLSSATVRPAARPVMRGHGFSWEAIKTAARHVNVPQLFMIFFVYSVAFSMMEQSLALFIEKVFVPGGTEGHAKRAALLTGYYLIVVGVTATVIQGALIGKLAKRFGEKKLLLLGAALIMISFILLPFIGAMGNFSVFLLMAWLTASGTGMLNPSLTSLLSRSVNDDEQGGALGLGQSLGALGRIFGPAVAGGIFEFHSGAPFWVGAVLMSVGILIGTRLGPVRVAGVSQ